MRSGIAEINARDVTRESAEQREFRGENRGFARLAGDAACVQLSAVRKPLILLVVLLAIHLALLAVHPGGAAQPPTGDAIDVGVVFDVGGRGDK
jgi:hypothetical protein